MLGHAEMDVVVLFCTAEKVSAAVMVCVGYWSSWQGEAVCNSKDMKDFLGIGAEDSCLGFYLVGSSERISTYRSKRGDMSDKVVWK